MIQGIKEVPTLLDIWREILCDLMSLMNHIIEASRLLAMRRDLDDRDNSSSSTTRSSSTPSIDEGGRDHPSPPPSPHPYH
jgi:hypothetical protein